MVLHFKIFNFTTLYEIKIQCSILKCSILQLHFYTDITQVIVVRHGSTRKTLAKLCTHAATDIGKTLDQNNECYFLKVEISAHLLSRADL